ncbi:hypothetical protein XENOCAPTIV_013087, partial [Xenoophorus captivus]
LAFFGISNQVAVTFKEENTMTFKHLFLKDYDQSSDDSLAVYTQQDVYDHMFYAVEKYLTLPETTVGRYAYVYDIGVNGSALSLCQQYYKKGQIDPANDTFNIDPHIVTAESYTRVTFDVAVSLVCLLSLLLCGRSLLRGIMLQQVREFCYNQDKTYHGSHKICLMDLT